jgi:asparagine synthase (glutamine-hydrolysing)
MCGICGSTNDREGRAIAAMNEAMVHRGPDDEGRYVDAQTGVALGARRLSIIDVEGGHQPLANEDRTVFAVLNGEIYNHPMLRRHLEARGHRLATDCDTEVLVHLYEDYGDALVHALEGMFAFALWDTKRQRLLVARDRFGEKPLFYADQGGELVFASELTAVLAGKPGLDELDPVAVDEFFVFGYVPGPRSMIRGVRQLPPAHQLVWDAATRTPVIERYWEAPVHTGDRNTSWRDLAGEFELLLESSVRDRLISDVPLGVFLSGGVDSTLVAALAARCSDVPIKTFTIGYEEGSVNETEPARQAARLLGADHHEVILSSSEAAARSVSVLSALDQPIADQALIALHAVAEFARRDVTVAVGGEGADELFAGYPRYRWMARLDRVERRVPAPVMHAGAAVIRRLRSSRATRLADIADPQPLLERHIDWVTQRRRHLRERLYGPALSGRVDQWNVVRGMDLGSGDGTIGIVERFMRLDQNHWLPDDVLAKADRATMRVSLEMRTPYLHREIAELAATASHIGGGGKAVVRALLRKTLPGSDVGRAKVAFRVPAADWLRGPLADQLRRQTERGAICREGWFDGAALGAMVDEHVAGRKDFSHVLWPILAFGLWLDRLRGDADG